VTARFARRGEHLQLTMSEAEHELLRALPDELRELYEDDSGTDEARERLFPRAYLDPTEEHAEEEWQQLVHPELLRDRLTALAQVTSSLERAAVGRRGELTVDLSPDEVSAFLGVLNDARLALGTRLGVSDDTDLADLEVSLAQRGDPRAPMTAVYSWLTYLEGELVEELLAGLPEEGEDD